MDKFKIKKNGQFIQIPLSAFQNNTNFITNSTSNLLNYYLKSETYTKTEVNNIISQIQSFHYQIVQTLPQTGADNILYLVPRETEESNNIYDEYVYANNNWEKIGSTQIDLTGYATENWVNLQISDFLTSQEIEDLINDMLDGYVYDEDYIHTDNNFDDDYMTKLDNIDIRIPNINIKCIVKDGEKYLRLVFGAYSKAFEDYVANNGISIHLLRYKNCSRREWNEVIKTKEKKWMHPANTTIFDKPDKQCWGFACYQPFMSQDDYYEQIENADYYIANNGMVQSEYILNYTSFKKGYLDINVRDLMSCVVKRGGPVTPEDTDMKIPTYGDGGLIKIMGTRTSPRRKRIRQPIKYVFALPITTVGGTVKYQYGTSNEAILELMTLRDSRAMKGYGARDKLLPDIGFGVLIK